MAGTSTVYDIKIRYAMDGDKASKSVKDLAANTDKAAKSALSLKGALAAIGGVAALKTAKSVFIDFNSEIDQMKIGLTAVMQMQLKYPFEKARQEADKLFNIFQQLAKKSPATTKDFMDMGNAIAPVVAMMGGGPDKIAKLAQGGVLASQAFGERADVVALDIKQMLSGTVNSKDRIAQQLIAAKGMDAEKFNALDSKKRASMTESMLQDPALLKAADSMGASFKGQVSTLQDQLEMALGQVGLPLMQAITAEVSKWNAWIETHPKTIKEWATSFGEKMSAAFDTLKAIAGWFIEHKDLLIDLAKMFVMFKGAQIATNVFKKFTDGVGGMAEAMKNMVGNFKSGGIGGLLGTSGGGIFGGFAKLVPVIGNVIAGLGIFSSALDIAKDAILGNEEERKRAREAAIDLNEATADFPTLSARREGILAMQKDSRFAKYAQSGEGKLKLENELAGIEKQMFSPEKVGLAVRKIHEASVKHGGLGIKDLTMEQLASGNLGRIVLPKDFMNSPEEAKTMGQVLEVLKIMQKTGQLQNTMVMDQILKYAFPEQYGMPTPTEDKPPQTEWKGLSGKDINVTIHKVEVASEDPDRFVFQLVRIADNALKHSTQSQHTTPGGM